MVERGTGLAVDGRDSVDVTIIMPCLNEVRCLPACIANAREALAQMHTRHGLTGEIVIADNGSTDGSQALATSLGVSPLPGAAMAPHWLAGLTPLTAATWSWATPMAPMTSAMPSRWSQN